MKYRLLREMFKDWFTDSEQSYDLFRLGFIAFSLVFIICVIYTTIKNGTFDLIDYSIGAGALLGCGSGSVSLRERFEKKQKKEDEDNV